MVSVRSLDELNGNPNAVTRAADTPFENGLDIQDARNGADVLLLAPEREGRGSCRDAQPRDLGQSVEDLLGQAIAEVLVLFFRAEVCKRQHCDRSRTRSRRLRVLLRTRPGNRLSQTRQGHSDLRHGLVTAVRRLLETSSY